jgi:hypothetical protein
LIFASRDDLEDIPSPAFREKVRTMIRIRPYCKVLKKGKIAVFISEIYLQYKQKSPEKVQPIQPAESYACNMTIAAVD